MKRFNKAFTLTELLVALGVIAVLCAVLMPVIFNSMPNQNTMMAKRAFYAVQSIVSDLINNEACYPDKTAATEARIGFDDGWGYPNCPKWGGIENTDYITTGGDSSGVAAVKFAYLFFDRLGVTGEAAPSDDPFILTNETTSFISSDGMFWILLDPSAFDTTNDASKEVILVVDVNGAEKPNLGVSTYTSSMVCPLGYSCEINNSSTSYDRFAIRIAADGGVKIHEDDTWAIDAVSVNKDITEAK